MNDDAIRAGVLATLQAIAPEVADAPPRPDAPLRREVDLDSMDWLNVIVGLHERFGIAIPESDYARLTTLDAVVAYIAARTSGPRLS